MIKHKLAIKSLLVMTTLCTLASCTGTRYNLFQDVKKENTRFIYDHAGQRPTISLGQTLCITVSGLNEESAQYFRASTEREGATGKECLYYTVDSLGQVMLPLIGPVEVGSMTLMQAEERIRASLEGLIMGPMVRVEYTDFSVSVLGEVSLPGVHEVRTGEITLLEALAASGGLTQFAKRNTLLLIRRNEGAIEHMRIDLTGNDIWSPGHFYLHDGDAIVVESNSGRIANSQNLTAWGSVLVGLGTISAIILTSQQ